jgi:hypothetical protein
MKNLLNRLSELQLSLAEANALHGLKVAQLEQEIAELTPLADFGKANHDRLVNDYIQHKIELGELAGDDQVQTVRKVASDWSFPFIQGELLYLARRIAEKSLLTSPDKKQRSRSNSKIKTVRPKRRSA